MAFAERSICDPGVSHAYGELNFVSVEQERYSTVTGQKVAFPFVADRLLHRLSILTRRSIVRNWKFCQWPDSSTIARHRLQEPRRLEVGFLHFRHGYYPTVVEFLHIWDDAPLIVEAESV